MQSFPNNKKESSTSTSRPFALKVAYLFITHRPHRPESPEVLLTGLKHLNSTNWQIKTIAFKLKKNRNTLHHDPTTIRRMKTTGRVYKTHKPDFPKRTARSDSGVHGVFFVALKHIQQMKELDHLQPVSLEFFDFFRTLSFSIFSGNCFDSTF